MCVCTSAHVYIDHFTNDVTKRHKHCADRICWQIPVGNAFAMSRFELVKATVSPEESSSDAGIGGYVTWTKGNRSSATLDEIWTQSERKQVRSTWEGAIENWSCVA